MKRFLAFILISMTVTSLVVGVFAGVGAANITAASDQSLQAMQTAEQLYQKGEYALAAETYQQLADQGLVDDTLYYNLGLSYLRAGELGHALWSLRLAQQVAPRDEGIQTALADVRTQITQSAAANDQTFSAVIEATGNNALSRVAVLTNNWFTIDELAMLALGLWTAFALMLLVWILKVQNHFLRRLAKIASPIVGALLIVAVLALGSRMYQTQRLTEAVVVADQIELNSGPGNQYGARMALPAGAEVNVLEERGDWVFVKLDGNGPTGWAPADSVATLRFRG